MNVVVVGWGEGASAPDYPKAVANTRLVAKQVYMLVKLMIKKGMDVSRIHLIGHSLGAHVSGYVGADLNGQLGRISGEQQTFTPPTLKNIIDDIYVDLILHTGTCSLYIVLCTYYLHMCTLHLHLTLCTYTFDLHLHLCTYIFDLHLPLYTHI